MAITMIAFTAEAQLTVGLESKLIFNDTDFSSGEIDLNKTVKSMTGYSIGGVVEYDLNENWSVSSGLSYKHIGFQIVESTSFGIFGLDIPIGATLKTTVNYLELPVLFKYKHDLGNVTAYLEAGPSVNYALNGNVKTLANSFLDFNVYETDINLRSQSYSRVNTSGNIGAGIIYPYTEDITFSAGIRYSKDLSSSVELPIVNTAIKNSSVSLGVSVGKRF